MAGYPVNFIFKWGFDLIFLNFLTVTASCSDFVCVCDFESFLTLGNWSNHRCFLGIFGSGLSLLSC